MTMNIEKESEDLFAAGRNDSLSDDEDDVQEDTTERLPDAPEEDEDEEEEELSAAAALTSLVSACRSASNESTPEATDEEKAEGPKGDDDSSKEFIIPQRFTKSGRKRAVSFPLKLMKVLSTKSLSDVICWTPSGKAFEIRKPKQFVAEILPEHFKSAKYSSFTRKLHRWGFLRHYRGEEAGAFYHEMFLKGRLDLVEQMTCNKEGPESPSKSATSKPKTMPIKKRTPAQQPTASNGAQMSAGSRTNKPVVTVDASRAISAPRQSGQNMSPPTPSQVVVAAPSSSSVDLNAAIEMEVARRLKERLNAATISRQALVLMEHHQQQQQAKLNALLEQRYIALAQQQERLRSLSQAPPALGGGTIPLYNANKPHGVKPPASANLAFGASARSLPQTNIQGAKTA